MGFCEHILCRIRGHLASIERLDSPLDLRRPSSLDVGKRDVQRLEHRFGKLCALLSAQGAGAIFNLFQIRFHEVKNMPLSGYLQAHTIR